jgi:DNA polymerase-3 subunit alpha
MLAERGMEWRYGPQAHEPTRRARLDMELAIIHSMGFDTYFLIVWDLCQYARSTDIWWNVRGSAAGSLTAYCLGITNIDPIANELIFERFLNPGRVSMPDIDMDFPDDRRADMIEYAMRKYGSEKVAAIITFGTLKARAAIKDVARVLNYPLQETNRLTAMVPNVPSKPVTLAQCLSDDPEKAVPGLREAYAADPEVRRVLDMALTIEGVARNAGTHAAGVIISDQPLDRYLPLHRPMGDSRVSRITQFPMETCEQIGLLKVDFLGLATLTIMRKACELIERYHDISFTMDNIPYRPDPEDPQSAEKVKALFDLIGRGDTAGVFQLESGGMRTTLTKMKPKTFEHIIAAISLYRPGPMQLIDTYVKRMHGEEPITYHHPKLEPILSETYSIIIYQEQIQQIAAQLFGYSLADADLMRRAVSKKKAKDLAEHKGRFMQRGPENGVSEQIAEKIFDEIAYFAAYGFNKCVTYNTEIIDADTGRLVKIGDVVTGKAGLAHTMTCDEPTLRLQPGGVGQVWDNGIKPVYRLTTQLGHQIEATANHPFYCFGGWRTLEALAVGERIAVPRRLSIEGKRAWPDHEVIILGHLLAEGNLCHPHGVYYYTKDQAQWCDYVYSLEQFDNTVASTHHRRQGMHDVYSKKADPSRPNGVMTWLKKLNLHLTDSYTKFIPDEVFELTNRQIALLIARMWEGDGNISDKSRFVYYATASARMVRQLQHLLLRLGIVSRQRRVRFAYRGGERFGYQLHICGNDNLKTFLQAIAVHFISDARRQTLAQMILESPLANGTKDSVPVGVREIVRQEKARRGITWSEVAVGASISITEFEKPSNKAKSGFTRKVIGQVAEYFNSADLRRLAANDIYWDQIVSIEYIGELPTYDLTIPGTHNFIANNILVHNSHAADYAVLTCQTAYLKAHFPAEYYTALLSVQRHNIADVSLFTSDCRSLGIPVLPPDINASDLDFIIQSHAATAARGIRYGLGAVKNAGEKAIAHIIEAREAGGPFTDIGSFCRRVDLRQVGKRAMESMIQVGVFDSIADRDQLFGALEAIMKYSEKHHDAKRKGLVSLFGANEDMLTLPKSGKYKTTTTRERLKVEKELVGLYVSPHPLQKYISQLQQLPNFAYVRDLLHPEKASGADDGEPTSDGDDEDDVAGVGSGILVALTGLVVTKKAMTTKSGDAMAILTVEDLTGSIECVLFPRTYAKFDGLCAEDNLIIVRGKTDFSRGRLQVVVEHVTDNFDFVVAADDPMFQGDSSQSGYFSPSNAQYAPPPADDDADDLPTPSTWSYPRALDASQVGTASSDRAQTDPHIMMVGSVGVEVRPDMPGYEPISLDLESLDTIAVVPKTPQRLPPCQVTITIRREIDPEKADQQQRKIWGVRQMLNSYPGEDRYRFRVIFPHGKIVMLEYPDTTHYAGDVENYLASKFAFEDIDVAQLPMPDAGEG